jgi:subtilisin family serine protease
MRIRSFRSIWSEVVERHSERSEREARMPRSRLRGASAIGLWLLALSAQATAPDAPFNRASSAITGIGATRWVVETALGSRIEVLALSAGAFKTRQLDVDGRVFLIEFTSPVTDYEALRSLANQVGGIVSIEPLVKLPSIPRLTIPNDPLFKKQWHLRNNGQYGGISDNDLNVLPAWDRKKGKRLIDGRGVTIGIVDSGVDFKHPDLKTRFRSDINQDILAGGPIGSDDVPSREPNAFPCPQVKFCHGTAVAGIAVAERDNNSGGSGVAPGAKFADLRLLYGPKDDLDEASAIKFAYDAIGVKNNSWGPCDEPASGAHYERDANGQFIFDLAHHRCYPATPGNPDHLPARSLPVGPGASLKAALVEAVTVGRAGRGVVMTWAAGNGGTPEDADHMPGQEAYQYQGDWNGYDGWACNRNVVGVGSIDNRGKRASYSERGPCQLVVAPVGELDEDSLAAVVTTDLVGTGNGYYPNGSYTVADDASAFAGTSAAAPMVAGVAGLMLQAQPTLTVRDVMHIMVRTARIVDPLHPSWKTNAAGRDVSYDYGFGLIDADAAVAAAKSWSLVSPQVSFSKQTTGNTAIPPNNQTGATFGMLVSQRIKVEHIEIIVGALHDKPGQLEVRVKSPSGTIHVIGVPQTGRAEADLFYLFTTPHFWDELGEGLWQVSVANRFPGGTGSLQSVKINVYGTPY